MIHTQFSITPEVMFTTQQSNAAVTAPSEPSKGQKTHGLLTNTQMMSNKSEERVPNH